MRALRKITSTVFLLLFVVSGIGVTIVQSPCGMFSQGVNPPEHHDNEDNDCDNCSEEDETDHAAQFSGPDQQCCTHIVSTVVKTDFENPTSNFKYLPTLIAKIISTDAIQRINITHPTTSFQEYSPPGSSEIFLQNSSLRI